MNAAVFLDRDNTLIHNDGDLGDPELVKLIQGAAAAVASLRGLNYKIIVVSNQGGVARGNYTEQDVELTNQRVADLVKAASGANIDRFYYCPYHPKGTVPEYTTEHEWRKPAPGMLIQAAQDMRIDLSQSWMVGDQMGDVQAGVAAGTRCILLRPDAKDLVPLRNDQLRSGQIEVTDDIAHFTARNLIEAVRIIAKQRKPEAEQSAEQVRQKWDPVAVRAAREAKNNPSAALPATGAPSSSEIAKPDVPPSAKSLTPPEPTPPTAPVTLAPEPEPEAEAQRKAVQESPSASPSGLPHQLMKHKTRSASNEQTYSQPRSKPAETKTVETEPVETKTEPSTSIATTPSEPKALSAASTPSVHGGSGVQGVEHVLDDTDDFEEDHSTTTQPRPRVASAELTLRQILQELRGQRTVQNDFSFVRMLAVVLQILAAFLLVAGLLLGAQDMDTFTRWIATAILVQLATIAMLLLEH